MTKPIRTILRSFALAGAITLAAVPAATAQLGHVDFPNSGSADAQADFIRGVLLLHSFEYEEARDAFLAAQRKDPGFAMAYWGEAMTFNHPVWNQQDLAAGRAALSHLGPDAAARQSRAATPREAAYLGAVEVLYGEGSKAARDTAYSLAMAALAKAWPDDLEAQTFYALSLLGIRQGDRDVPAYMRAGAIAENVFAVNPQHPGAAHYAIHAFDDPVHAPLGLRAARAYSGIAPDAPHAQHMTSHIFLALGMWDDVVASNEAATANSPPPGAEGHHARGSCGHYGEWLAYGYLQQGRPNAAAGVVEECVAIANRLQRPRPRASLVEEKAIYVVDTQDWRGALADLPIDTTGVRPWGALKAVFTAGMIAAMRGDPATAARKLADYEALRARVTWPDDENASTPPTALAMEHELRAMVRAAEGDTAAALVQVDRAIAIEDSLPFIFGPPATGKPSREYRAELLLASGHPAQAAGAFEQALAQAPGRSLALLGLARAASAAGDATTARRAYAELVANWHRAEPGYPGLAEATTYLNTHTLGTQ